MGPVHLEARQQYNCQNGYADQFGNCVDNYNTFGNWGRWVLFAAIVIGAFLLFLSFACITARRRRRLGQQPFRGTGWAAGGHGPVQYNNAPPPQQYYQGPPPQQQGPPVYSPPPYPPQNAGYFGGQQSGIELQQPTNAYQPQSGGENVYKKEGDNVVR